MEILTANQKCFQRNIVDKVYNIIFWLKSFPHDDCICNIIITGTIIAWLSIDQNENCRLNLGSYIQVNNQGNRPHPVQTRTSGA